MDKAIPEEKLREGLDRIIREVTEASAGISLVRGEAEPGEHICTVHIGFRRGFQSSLSLRADAALFARLSRSMLHQEQITAQDLEDVAKEYFNVLCGHIVSRLFRETRVPARFSPPVFRRGRYVPEDHLRHIVLTYADDRNERAQLIQHAPYGEREAQSI